MEEWIWICVWFHKGYFVVKKLVWNIRIKAFWYTKRYVSNLNFFAKSLFFLERWISCFSLGCKHWNFGRWCFWTGELNIYLFIRICQFCKMKCFSLENVQKIFLLNRKVLKKSFGNIRCDWKFLVHPYKSQNFKFKMFPKFCYSWKITFNERRKHQIPCNMNKSLIIWGFIILHLFCLTLFCILNLKIWLLLGWRKIFNLIWYCEKS